MVLGQDLKDSLINLPFSPNIFDFDTSKVDDIVLYEYELSGIDTTSKKIIAQYKQDLKGRIICARYPNEKYDRHVFYSYMYYPKIFALFSQSKFSCFSYYSVDMRGKLTNFTFYGLHNENIWVKEYNSLFKYDSNSKLIEKLVNSAQAENWRENYQYYENGYLKKYSFTQDYLNSRDSLMSEYNYKIANNSSHATFTKKEGSEQIIYDHVLNYNVRKTDLK